MIHSTLPKILARQANHLERLAFPECCAMRILPTIDPDNWPRYANYRAAALAVVIGAIVVLFLFLFWDLLEFVRDAMHATIVRHGMEK